MDGLANLCRVSARFSGRDHFANQAQRAGSARPGLYACGMDLCDAAAGISAIPDRLGLFVRLAADQATP